MSSPSLWQIRGNARWALAAGLAAMLLSFIALSLYTNAVWEDFLITYRHSKNFLEGNGLVFQPGEHVHGFTSPINVLAATFSGYFFADHDPLKAIWVYRVLSLSALLGIVWLSALLFHRDEPNGIPVKAAAIFLLLFAIEFKTICYALNGQEPAFTILFIALALQAVQSGHQRLWGLAGLAWGGIMWSRPEGFIYIAGLGLGSLLWSQPNERKGELAGLVKAALVCTAVYLPWFVGAWLYYGSPIPHTILAKATLINTGAPLAFIERLPKYLSITMALIYTPIYVKMGDWPAWCKIQSLLMFLPCLFYWLLPLRDKLGRTISLTATFAITFLYLVSNGGVTFPWYFPPAAFLGLLLLVRIWFTIPEGFPALRPWRQSAAACGMAVLLLVGAGMMKLYADSALLAKILQEEVELKCRKPVGEWLHAHVKPGERVYLECLGYIGYYSNAKMLDYPGLASPEVVNAIRNHHTGFFTTVAYLKPEWIVFRKVELDAALTIPGLLQPYKIAAEFQTPPLDEIYENLPPAGELLRRDNHFLILHRDPDPAPEPPAQNTPPAP